MTDLKEWAEIHSKLGDLVAKRVLTLLAELEATKLSARCAAERVDELTSAARYLMVALHSCAAAESRADVLAIARNAAEKWPDLAPGSAPHASSTGVRLPEGR